MKLLGHVMCNQSVECIKNIVDFHRCRICDKEDGSRARYPCGHTACETCILEATNCLTCLTPPDIHSYSVKLDEPLTLKTKNVLALKKAFEDTFNIDIYKRHRLSDLLKIEEELFPTPIKATEKYCNKRKILISPAKNKEDLNILGEQISPLNKMTSKNSYVQQWLDSKDTTPRKPFTDLDVNRSFTLQNIPNKKTAGLILNNAYEESDLEVPKSLVNKNTDFKTSLLFNCQSKFKKHLNSIKKQETTKWCATKFKNYIGPTEKLLHYEETYKDESGIVMDEEVISINDSQSVVIDKDREAWLAVLRAGEADESEPTPRLQSAKNIRHTLDVGNTQSPQERKNTSTYSKIPFIKRSSLSDPWHFCNEDTQWDQNHTADRSKNVSITIENNSFITTITVFDNRKAVEPITKKSTYVQTDIQGLSRDQSIAAHTDVAGVQKECAKESQNLFTIKIENENLVDNITVENSEPAQNIITTRIPGSESNDGFNQSSIIEVTADVHRTRDLIDYGLLSVLKETDLGLKTKPKKRRKTPASSNSSEKENFDPNKRKKRNLGNKSDKKEKTKIILSK